MYYAIVKKGQGMIGKVINSVAIAKKLDLEHEIHKVSLSWEVYSVACVAPVH